MTVKILSSTSTFKGVSYNTNKMQSGKGELMKFKNFGYLQSAQKVTPAEMKTFLKVHSNRNTRVQNKQFHAIISCKEREYNKKELTKMAEKWLEKMGYGDNPYLIVFHGDTKNNHVHMVSTRIGNDGKKINDSMERIRAQKCMLEIMERNPAQECRKVLDQLKSFTFSTLNQAKLYLEIRGYNLQEKEDKLFLYKFGLLQGELSLKEIMHKTNAYTIDKARKKQLHALFEKYRKVYCSTPVPIFEPLKGNRLGKPKGYRSEMADFLKEKFGIELVFHGRNGKTPYGYTVIDHSRRIIFKGGEIYPLKNLNQEETRDKVKVINFLFPSDISAYKSITGASDTLSRIKRFPENVAYRLKLLSVLEDYPNLQMGLEEFKLHLLVNEKRLFLLDTQERFFIRLEAILKNKEYNRFARLWEVSPRNGTGQTANLESGSDSRLQLPIQADSENVLSLNSGNEYAEPDRETVAPLPAFNLDIHQDVDDEALHGRRRNKDKDNKKRSIR